MSGNNMQLEHYRILLWLYKEKIAGNLSDEKINEQKLEAKIELDNAIVMENNTDHILEYLNELDRL